MTVEPNRELPMITLVTMRNLSGVTGGMIRGAAQRYVEETFPGTKIIEVRSARERDQGYPVMAVTHQPIEEP